MASKSFLVTSSPRCPLGEERFLQRRTKEQGARFRGEVAGLAIRNSGSTHLIESSKRGTSDILIISESNLFSKDLTYLNLISVLALISYPDWN